MVNSILFLALGLFSFTNSQTHDKCANRECIFADIKANSILTCTNTVETCNIECGPNSICDNIRIYSGAKVTNWICSTADSCRNSYINIIEYELPSELSQIGYRLNQFQGPKETATIIAIGSNSCSSCNINFNGRFQVEPLISSSGQNSLNNAIINCRDNNCQCQNCPVSRNLFISPDSRTQQLAFDNGVGSVTITCHGLNQCNNLEVYSGALNFGISCAEDACIGLNLNLGIGPLGSNIGDYNVINGNANIICSGCHESNIKINGDYNVNINGLSRSGLINSNIDVNIPAINICSVDCDPNNRGCENLVIIGCNCPNCHLIVPIPDTFKTVTRNDNTCNIGIGVCYINCGPNGMRCGEQVFMSSAAMTIINCGESGCEGAMFLLGTQDAALVTQRRLDPLDFESRAYEGIELNCNSKSSCKGIQIEINGNFRSDIIINAGGLDSFVDGYIDCNVRVGSICTLNCGARACNPKVLCENQCICNNMDPTSPTCPGAIAARDPRIESINGQKNGIYGCDDTVEVCMLDCGKREGQCEKATLYATSKRITIDCTMKNSCKELNVNIGPNTLILGSYTRDPESVEILCGASSSCNKIKVDATNVNRLTSDGIIIKAHGIKAVEGLQLDCNTRTGEGRCTVECPIEASCQGIKSNFLTGFIACRGGGCLGNTWARETYLTGQGGGSVTDNSFIIPPNVDTNIGPIRVPTAKPITTRAPTPPPTSKPEQPSP